MASPTSQHIRVKPLPRSLYPATISYQPSDFTREDESSDTEWYSQPRFVQHIDEGAIAALKSYYASIIKPEHCILDVCSSWVSHLPATLKPQGMIGYGMNSAELARNHHLAKFYVRDLNENPSLSEVPDESTDIIICNVSIDYLTKPIKIFDEMRRVLKVGGTAHMAFSNRCFPTKVVGKWMGMSDEERRMWVGGYFWASGGWEGVEDVVLKEERGGLFGDYEDPMFIVRGRKAG